MGIALQHRYGQVHGTVRVVRSDVGEAYDMMWASPAGRCGGIHSRLQCNFWTWDTSEPSSAAEQQGSRSHHNS